MGQQVIKTAPDRDLYLLWSSITDSWLIVGTRAELLDELSRRDGWGQEIAERALVNADEYGSSAFRPFGCHWDTETLMVGEGSPNDGWYDIRRERLVDYADALLRDDEKAAVALLERYDEDGDD